MTQLITIDPDPPVHGKTAKICYAGSLPVTLSLQWDPPGKPTSVNLTVECVTIDVPADASTLVIVDDSGFSDDLPCVVA